MIPLRAVYRLRPLGVVCVAFALAGCGDDKPSVPLAPTSSALAAPKPAAPSAVAFAVDKASSKVDFHMDAAEEKIVGHAPGATTGTLNVDPSDVTKTTGLLTVDISGLEIFQAALTDAGFGPEHKEDKQNEHAHNWLELGKDIPADQRAKNAMVQFSIKSVTVTGEKDLTKLTGDTRKVALKAKGDFLLHGHKTEKEVDLEAEFTFAGAAPASVHVKTVTPFAVGLAENDVRPRDTIGKLLAKGLDALSSKVAKDAMVSVDFTAKPAGK